MAVEILAKQESVGFLQQSKVSNHWSAPAAANANFKIIQWITAGTPVPNPGVIVENINSTSQNGTHREYERIFVDKISGPATLPIAGIADKTTLAGLLAITHQGDPSEPVGGVYPKDFPDGGLTAPIDFATNGGYLFTFAIRQQASADDGIILENGIMQNLNLIWDLNATGSARCMQYNGTVLFNEINYEQTLSGTWTNATPSTANFYNDTDLWAFTTLTIDSVVYTAELVKRVEIQFNNNVTLDGRTTGGKAAQYRWKPERNLIFRLTYNSATEKLLKDFQDGVRVQAVWANDVAADNAGELSFNMPYCIIQNPPSVYDGDYKAVEINAQILSNAAATPITTSITDSIDWGF